MGGAQFSNCHLSTVNEKPFNFLQGSTNVIMMQHSC